MIAPSKSFDLTHYNMYVCACVTVQVYIAVFRVLEPRW